MIDGFAVPLFPSAFACEIFGQGAHTGDVVWRNLFALAVLVVWREVTSEPAIKIEMGRSAHSPKSPHTYSKLCPTAFTGDFSRLREHWGIPAGHCSSARPGIWKCSVTVPEPCGVKQKYMQNSGQIQQVIWSEGNTPNTPMGLQLQYFLT